MLCNPAIFRAYDIRGVFGEDFDAEMAERVGRAVVIHTGAKSVIVGRDMRASSPQLAEAVIRGVTAAGADVVDIGLCSTPMFNVTVAFGVDAGPDARTVGAGIMVTASHNPAKYNGFKMDYPGALPISSVTGMDEVKRLVMEGAVSPPPTGRGRSRGGGVVGQTMPQTDTNAVGVPSGVPISRLTSHVSRLSDHVSRLDALPSYLSRITSLLNPSSLKPFRMVVDCGNGMAGLTMPALAPHIPGTVIPLYWELDGTFPNHEPNPIKPENAQQLMAAVRDEHADIGFAFDGDADRIGVVDDRGVLVRGDLLTVLLAREVLQQHPGTTILYDLRASRVVAEEITKAGGVPIPTRVGHALIKKHLRDIGAAFAGELSNHFYFSDFAGVEASEYAMLLFLRVLSESGGKFSDLIAPLERYHHSGEINFEVRDKDAALRELEARYAPHARSASKLDGLSFDMGAWWFNLRPSNTEPLLRLVVETSTQRETEERVHELARAIG